MIVSLPAAASPTTYLGSAIIRIGKAMSTAFRRSPEIAQNLV
ncbi:hypothetical protein [Altererythrobacter lauratis]|uniref:Uncharacterized protein n=1 Tax=Alteraurantiacibacter lauratis TaxID=2054627 RepID=A0ABV7EG33_9SPHN